MTGFVAQEVSSVMPKAVFSVSAPTENKGSNITFNTGSSEMLRVAEDGFYVRGKKLDVDDKEAAAVYKAFREFLIWSALTRK